MTQLPKLTGRQLQVLDEVVSRCRSETPLELGEYGGTWAWKDKELRRLCRMGLVESYAYGQVRPTGIGLRAFDHNQGELNNDDFEQSS